MLKRLKLYYKEILIISMLIITIVLWLDYSFPIQQSVSSNDTMIGAIEEIEHNLYNYQNLTPDQREQITKDFFAWLEVVDGFDSLTYKNAFDSVMAINIMTMEEFNQFNEFRKNSYVDLSQYTKREMVDVIGEFRKKYPKLNIFYLHLYPGYAESYNDSSMTNDQKDSILISYKTTISDLATYNHFARLTNIVRRKH